MVAAKPALRASAKPSIEGRIGSAPVAMTTTSGFSARIDAFVASVLRRTSTPPFLHHRAMIFGLVVQHLHVGEVRIVAGPVHRAAEGGTFLQHHDVVADLLGGDRVFHAARSAADDDDLLRPQGRTMWYSSSRRRPGSAPSPPSPCRRCCPGAARAPVCVDLRIVLAALAHLFGEVGIVEREAADADALGRPPCSADDRA